MGTDWPGGTLSSEDAWGWAAKGSSGSLNIGAQKCQAEDENRCSSLDKALIVYNLIQHILTEHQIYTCVDTMGEQTDTALSPRAQGPVGWPS